MMPVSSDQRPTQWIVLFGVAEWSAGKQRSHHLAHRLSKSYDVLFVNPCYLSAFGYLRDALLGNTKRPAVFDVKAVQAGLHVATFPPLLPKGLNFPAIGRFNHWAIRPLLKRVAQRLEIRHPILWLSLPPDRALIRSLSERLVVYDCMDQHAAFRSGETARRLAREEERLLHAADIVFASSEGLLDHCSRHNENVYLVRNGVDPEWFRAQATKATPSELPFEPSRPTVGYVGTIGPWVDIDLLKEIAISYPMVTLVLVGPAEVDLSVLERIPNITITGQLPYQKVPGIIQHLDVCLLPFKVNLLTRSVNPIKLYEYLALGKAIVSTPLPEVVQFGKICYLSEPGQSYIAAIGEALNEGQATDLIQQRRRVADENTWAKRAEEIVRVLDAHLWNRESVRSRLPTLPETTNDP
jgi:glycosyltransferase involved in cell wall biosynthesis